VDRAVSTLSPQTNGAIAGPTEVLTPCGPVRIHYVCMRSPAARKVGECAQRCVRATRVEDAVWCFISELLKDPDRIRAGIEELVEREAGRSDPDGEARLWEARIAECSRLRSAYQHQQGS